MHSQAKLSDAAIAIDKALTELGVEYGIFGGYAIATLGGRRESKDIDCAVNCAKDWLVRELSKKEGFNFMGNVRPNLAQFIFGKHNVLLEFFPSACAQNLSWCMVGLTLIQCRWITFAPKPSMFRVRALAPR